MRIESINRGEAESINHGARTIVTGINKQVVNDGIRVGINGLDGDTICDNHHHGGVDQAVYAYSVSDYQWWSQRKGRRIASGTFGENLTIDGLPSDMNAGERLLIGNVILEVTAPRIPCSTLAAQMRDSNFGLEFRRAERPGFYFRVLNEGEIATGDSVTFVENPDCDVTMLELFRLSYEPSPSEEKLRRVLEAPIAERMRQKFEARLQKHSA